jgi:hypothetical protein
MIKKARTDSGYQLFGPMVLPGMYTLKLTVDGKSYSTPLEVRPDPRVSALDSMSVSGTNGAGAAALEEQLKLALAMRDDITRLTDIVERLRSIRKQLNERNDLLKEDPRAAALIKASKEFITKLDDLEATLHNPKAQVTYDILAQKGGAKLYSQFAWLYELIRASDGAPTQGLKEVYADQNTELKKLGTEFDHLLAQDLSQLNEQARKIELPGIIVPKETARRP